MMESGLDDYWDRDTSVAKMQRAQKELEKEDWRKTPAYARQRRLKKQKQKAARKARKRNRK